MTKKTKLARAVAMVLTGAALGAVALPASAQSTFYAPNTTIGTGAPTVGNLPSSYTVASSTAIFAWDGHNNSVGGVGYGWGHNSNWVVFNLAAPTALDIRMTSGTGGSGQANFNSAFTLWSTAGYTDPAGSNGNGHTFSQVSTGSAAGGGPVPWLTDPTEGGVTGFVGYANSGPAGWHNADSLTVGSGAELNGTGYVNTVTVGGHNAELLTGVLPAGQYLIGLGGSDACGTFLGNTGLASCTGLSGSGNYSLAINQVSAVPIPAAVWLFGSALGGLGVFGRRKDKLPA